MSRPSPDGILLSPPAFTWHAGAYFARRHAPAAILRINFNSMFCFSWGYKQAVVTRLIEPEEALAMGADMVLVCLTLKTGSEATDARNAEIFADLCAKAHRVGLPVPGAWSVTPPSAGSIVRNEPPMTRLQIQVKPNARASALVQQPDGSWKARLASNHRRMAAPMKNSSDLSPDSSASPNPPSA